MDEYRDLVAQRARKPTSDPSRLSIYADVTSRSRRLELARHANVVPDGPFHFVLVRDGEHAIVSIGFSHCCLNGKIEVFVRQLQGTRGSQPVLSSLRWEHLLLSVVETFARERHYQAVRVLAAQSNPWVQRMYDWMIDRGVLQASDPLSVLFEDGDLVERARTSWKAWWEEESRHPHFTRFLGLLDPRTIRLRYDKTARRRGYILCEESVDLPRADRVMRYWRKPLD